jgi:holo-[acyl-carrier protein] synthase
LIKGIGTDILEIERLERLDLERLAFKILTEQEREKIPIKPHRRYEFLAGRFAAKEAIAKACGTGIGQHIGWRDIEILPNEKGKPQVHLSERVQEKLLAGQSYAIHLSISHSHGMAVAMAVWEVFDH